MFKVRIQLSMKHSYHAAIIPFRSCFSYTYMYHTIPINQPTRCNNFSSYLTFMYSSTCFGRPHANDQELNNCSSSLWFYLRSVVITVLFVVVGSDNRPDHDQQHRYHHAPKVKPEAATAVVELLVMGVRCPKHVEL